MAPSPVDKQPAGYKSPHGWLVSLAMDLATFEICGGADDASGCHLAVFGEDVAVAPHPPTLPKAYGLMAHATISERWRQIIN